MDEYGRETIEIDGVEVEVVYYYDGVWGVETWKNYHKECAREMATALVRGIHHEQAEALYWRERDVITV